MTKAAANHLRATTAAAMPNFQEPTTRKMKRRPTIPVNLYQSLRIIVNQAPNAFQSRARFMHAL
jgi:hypothetical protein